MGGKKRGNGKRWREDDGRGEGLLSKHILPHKNDSVPRLAQPAAFADLGHGHGPYSLIPAIALSVFQAEAPIMLWTLWLLGEKAYRKGSSPALCCVYVWPIPRECGKELVYYPC